MSYGPYQTSCTYVFIESSRFFLERLSNIVPWTRPDFQSLSKGLLEIRLWTFKSSSFRSTPFPPILLGTNSHVVLRGLYSLPCRTWRLYSSSNSIKSFTFLLFRIPPLPPCFQFTSSLVYPTYTS